MTLPAYDRARDNTATDEVRNFLYTDENGQIQSAPYTEVHGVLSITDSTIGPNDDTTHVFLTGATAAAEFNLPDATISEGRRFVIKALDVTNPCNIVSLNGNQIEDPLSTGNTLSFIATLTLNPVGRSETFVSDGTNWLII